MSSVQVKLEGPQPQPYFYPKSLAAAKIINVPDYRIINFNYLFEHAKKTGHHRDRLPLYNPMKKSKHVDPFTGKNYRTLPPILFDQIGSPAGWGVPLADAYARGPVLGETFIGANDDVLGQYRQIDMDITVEVCNYCSATEDVFLIWSLSGLAF